MLLQMAKFHSFSWLCSIPVVFAGGSAVKNLPANEGDEGWIPGLERSPGEGNGNPLQCSCLEIQWTKEPGGLQSMGSQGSQT